MLMEVQGEGGTKDLIGSGLCPMQILASLLGSWFPFLLHKPALNDS